jgi:hypothetical protein
MKICIVNNWTHDEHWWVYKLLKNYFKGEVELTKDSQNCDILLFSNFGVEEDYKTTKAKYKIFTSWETRFYIDITNQRMPYANLALSFMPTEGINFRLPLWYSWIDWWNNNNTDDFILVCGQSHHYIGKNILPDDLVPSLINCNYLYEPESVWNRPHFCSMLVGNPEPDSLSIRAEIFNEISKQIQQVNGFGLVFNNRFEGNKIALLRNFKFNICYENSVHKGYVTEKLFDAKFAGCIPIYRGDKEYSEIDFNKDCFINRLDYSNNTEFIQEIRKLNSEKNYFIEKIQQPLFKENQIPSLDLIYERFDNYFK